MIPWGWCLTLGALQSTWSMGIQIAMNDSTAGNAAFFVESSVIMMPVLTLVQGSLPFASDCLTAVVAGAGLFLITNCGIGTHNAVVESNADLLLIGCALLVSIGCILRGRILATGVYPLTLWAIEYVSSCVGAVAVAIASGESWSVGEPFTCPHLLLLGSLALLEATGQLTATLGQTTIDPTLATVILCLDTVVAVVVEFMWQGIILNVRQALGAVTLIGAIATGAYVSHNRNQKPPLQDHYESV
jgi:drug/metabolite transporter (DMT)-like permease